MRPDDYKGIKAGLKARAEGRIEPLDKVIKEIRLCILPRGY